MILVKRFLERPARPAWVFFAAAFAIRALGTLILFQNRAYFSDESMYLRLADVIARGQWLGEGTVPAPGVIYFLAALKMLGLGLDGIRIAQAAVGAASVAIIFLLARRLFGPFVAGAAAAVMCFYPYFIYLAGLFYPQGPFQLLLALLFFSTLRFMETDSLPWLLLAGVFLGLSGLFVVAILSAAPILALWILLRGKGVFLKRCRDVAVLAVVSVAVILPWTARNYAVTRQFIFISAMGPSAFYWANNAQADPTLRDPEKWLVIYQDRLNREVARQGMDAAELDRHLQFRSQRFLKAHPGRALHNYLTRLSFFFDAAPRSFTTNPHTRSQLTEIVAVVSSVPVLLLLPIGLWCRRRTFAAWFPLILVPVAQALSYAAFHVSVRYRLPFEPYFILFAVAGLFCLAGIGEKPQLEPERSGTQS